MLVLVELEVQTRYEPAPTSPPLFSFFFLFSVSFYLPSFYLISRVLISKSLEFVTLSSRIVSCPTTLEVSLHHF
jgi:hypothetical protein